ncbi:MAG: glycosyltransferase family 39 protein [Bryobacterales bacterium]|nr:glycosyltransferase family 39 protein [Bryobacterales bacterium]
MRAWLAIAALLALIRLPFLWTPIQGDDPYYLFGAQHALIDPLHPSHARYVFQGKEVDMRGHPHPPGNAWFLAAALALRGDVDEPFFHAFYLLWSLIAAAAAYSLARRFSSVPLWPTLLFLATPAFVINGNSLESDVPFVACWLAAFALFIRAVDTGRRAWLVAAVLALAAAAMMAYQSVAAIPILAFYLWQRRRTWFDAWAALLTPAAVIGLYQLFERLSSGALPAQVLTGYFTQYGLQSALNKLRNAAMLSIHMGWILFPALPLLAWRKGEASSTATRRPPPATTAASSSSGSPSSSPSPSPSSSPAPCATCCRSSCPWPSSSLSASAPAPPGWPPDSPRNWPSPSPSASPTTSTGPATATSSPNSAPS